MEGEGTQVPMVGAIEAGRHPRSEGLSSKKDYDHRPEEDYRLYLHSDW